ncbi:MAG: glutathione S-transferase family protein [Coxiellaceae bacterium]|nr:glutathione S-transferase family protein [Coxiellaceae bacterium]
MLTLYHGKRSTCSQKVRLCLAEKKIDWQSKIINIKEHENVSPLYLAINPDGVVPALNDDDWVITESNVINEYLDDTHPEPTMKPASLQRRALMRTVAQWTGELHHPFLRTLTHFNNPAKSSKSESHPAEHLAEEAENHPMASRKMLLLQAKAGACDGELALQEVHRVFDKLRRVIDQSPGPFLINEHMTLADIAWIPSFNRLEELELLEQCFTSPASRLALWWQLVKSRDSFQTAITDWLDPTNT